MAAPSPPPGWYPDPSGAPRRRYWDGRVWGATAPLPGASGSGRAWKITGAVIGGVVLLGVVGHLANGPEKPPSAPTTSAPVSAAPAAEPTAPTISTRPTPTLAPPGSAARDGKFEFRVLSVTSAHTVSDPSDNPYLTATAQGVFVIFTISVRNIGDEPRSYSGGNQKLFDASGREYGVSSDADLYMNSYGAMTDINPGNAIEVKVPFDVQPNIKMSMLELHDSMFSGGVRVAPAASP